MSSQNSYIQSPRKMTSQINNQTYKYPIIYNNWFIIDKVPKNFVNYQNVNFRDHPNLNY